MVMMGWFAYLTGHPSFVDAEAQPFYYWPSQRRKYAIKRTGSQAGGFEAELRGVFQDRGTYTYPEPHKEGE